MTPDAYYMLHSNLRAARHLQHAGQWEAALDALPSDGADTLRADILTTRSWWQSRDGDRAEEAVGKVPDPAFADFLRGQLAYARLLFDRDPRPADPDVARRGFETASGDERLHGWGEFWLGVFSELIVKDPVSAAGRYAAALKSSDGDPLLKSYAVRHQGFQAWERKSADATTLLRRSYCLRATLGARPAVAAAAVALADVLPAGEEAAMLRETAALTAKELQIPWL